MEARVGAFFLLCLLGTGVDASICSEGHTSEGSCHVDGSGCEGDRVQFLPYTMNVSKWNKATNSSDLFGTMNSYAITGSQNTWEMYLHGPHLRANERASEDSIPAIYVAATFMNKMYRFENFTSPATDSNGAWQTMEATQKVVGHVLAPSTAYVVEEANDPEKVKGLLIAEGQPFMVSNAPLPHEMWLGGVEWLENGAGPKDNNCSEIFPTDWHKIPGQVVNTIDCHKDNRVCFFSVWKFYDDQGPIWNPVIEKTDNDCLYYCMLTEDSMEGEPKCRKTAIVVDENNDPICHKDGVGAVHGMTVGNTDSSDKTQFDILLVFTGKAEMSNGESSMKKVRVQVVSDSANNTDLKVLKSQTFGEDLFVRYPPKGWDVGGDHAWVDETGKWVWVSCFREKGVGLHMLDYETGELQYSVTGLDKYVPNQYTYTAGIHGVGTIGKRGSYVAVATSSCHDINICIPTVPWQWPVPKEWWSTAPLFVIDIASMAPAMSGAPITVVV